MSDLYTGKGDKGLTTFFGSAQQYPKSALRVEALGVLDEANALLGLAKVRASDTALPPGAPISTIASALEQMQQDLFVIQAEVVGADKHLTQENISWLESLVEAIERELPPITTFFLAGGSELSATLDVARTVARTAERRLVSFRHDGAMTGLEAGQPRANTLVYINRVSSALYALSRYVNHQAGHQEKAPLY